jgi:hypothetical protein
MKGRRRSDLYCFCHNTLPGGNTKLNYSSGPHCASARVPLGRLRTFLLAAAAFLPLAAGCAKEKAPAIRAAATEETLKKGTLQAASALPDTARNDTAQAGARKEPRLDTVRTTARVVRLNHPIQALKGSYAGISGNASDWSVSPLDVTLSPPAQAALPPLVRMPREPSHLDTPGVHAFYPWGVPAAAKPCDTMYLHDTLFVYRTNRWTTLAHESAKDKRVHGGTGKDGTPIIIFEYECKSGRGSELVADTLPAFSYDTAYKRGPLLIRKHAPLRSRRYAHGHADTIFDTAQVASSPAPYATAYRHDTLPIYKILHEPDSLRLAKIEFYGEDDTARHFSLSRASPFFSEGWMNSSTLNLCAFRSTVARVSGVHADSTFFEQVIEINSAGRRSSLSLYLLPVTLKGGKPRQAGRYMGGRLALGFTYFPASNALVSGTYLLLEPDASDTLEGRKIRFTVAYSYVRPEKKSEDDYHGTSGSGSESHYPSGFIETQCAKYLNRHGYR